MPIIVAKLKASFVVDARECLYYEEIVKLNIHFSVLPLCVMIEMCVSIYIIAEFVKSIKIKKHSSCT